MDEVEVYMLCRAREKGAAVAFLDKFLPRRHSSADEFLFPELSDSTQEVYRSPEEVMERLELESNQSYALYWDSDEAGARRQAMLFFTSDGEMIAGLVVPAVAASKALVELAEVVGGQFGFLTTENPPPETSAQFIDLCRASTLTALVDGRVREGSAL